MTEKYEDIDLSELMGAVKKKQSDPITVEPAKPEPVKPVESKKYKILYFEAVGVRGLKVVSIIPENDRVDITGANGAGKSTVLDIITNVFMGGNMPINHEFKKGHVSLEIGNGTNTFILKKRFKKKGSPTLEIKSSDGWKPSSPLSFLKDLLGKKSLDPIAFTNMSAREQKKLVCDVFDINTSNIDSDISKIKQDRSDINAAIRNIKSYLATHKPDETVPEEEVGFDDIEEARKKAADFIAEKARLEQEGAKIIHEINLVATSITAHDNAISDKETQIEKLKQEIATIQSERDALHSNVTALDNKSATNRTLQIEHEKAKPVDSLKIDKIVNARIEVNKVIAANQTIKEMKGDLIHQQETYKAKGQEIVTLEESKKNAVGDKITLPGFEIRDKGCYYNNVPTFGNELCTSEKVIVGCSIIKAQNPKASIVLLDNTSLLDEETINTLHRMLNGFQIWVVMNNPHKESGDYYIEDGLLNEETVDNTEGYEPVDVFEV